MKLKSIFCPIGGALLSALILAGCAEEKKQASKSTPAPRKEVKAKPVPASADELLNQLVAGGVRYVVTERYPATGDKHNPEYIDSVWFDDSGRMLGKKTWWVDHGRRTPGLSLELTYAPDGTFDSGRETGDEPALEVLLSRNADACISRMEVKVQGEAGIERGCIDTWEWHNGLPSHYAQSTIDADYSETYKYPEEGGREPSETLAKTSDEEGSAQERISYSIRTRDEAGNWTERSASRERRIYEYDYNTGKVIESGAPVRESNIERRRIGYRADK